MILQLMYAKLYYTSDIVWRQFLSMLSMNNGILDINQKEVQYQHSRQGKDKYFQQEF